MGAERGSSSLRLLLLLQTVGVDRAARLWLKRKTSASRKFLIGWTATRRGKRFSGRVTHLAFGALSGLHAVATLDYIGLQAYRTGSAMQFEEQAAGVAEDRSLFVAAPQGCGGRAAILADRL